MSEIKQVTGTGIPLLLDDIDTDRIIPARFLRCVTFDGIGEHAFKDDQQQDPEHPFSDPRYQEASILVTGRNFGCGSSREHAPQSLMRWGIQAVVAESFAEIFFGNCTSLGIPAVRAGREDLERLDLFIQDHPQAALTIDLEQMQLRYPDGEVPLSMPESAREALLTGRHDALAQLLEATGEIRRTAESVPYFSNWGAGSL